MAKTPNKTTKPELEDERADLEPDVTELDQELDDEEDEFEDEFEEDLEEAKGWYLLKVELLKSKVPVWRRIVLPDNAQLSDLEYCILEQFGLDDDIDTDFYKGDDFKKFVTCTGIDVDYYDPDPTLRQVLNPGKYLGFELEDAKQSRFLVTLEQFVQEQSELPANLEMAQGVIKDEVPERFFLLKVQLKGAKPPVWRRILISSKKRFSDLHYAIQREFGWDNDHLAAFYADKGFRDEFCMSEYPGEFSPDPKLERYLCPGVAFSYLFDFGDCWRHVITVEKEVSDRSELPKKLIWSKGDNIPQYPDFDDEEEFE